jgi:hypothetical protein
LGIFWEGMSTWGGTFALFRAKIKNQDNFYAYILPEYGRYFRRGHMWARETESGSFTTDIQIIILPVVSAMNNKKAEIKLGLDYY